MSRSEGGVGAGGAAAARAVVAGGHGCAARVGGVGLHPDVAGARHRRAAVHRRHRGAAVRRPVPGVGVPTGDGGRSRRPRARAPDLVRTSRPGGRSRQGAPRSRPLRPAVTVVTVAVADVDGPLFQRWDGCVAVSLGAAGQHGSARTWPVPVSDACRRDDDRLPHERCSAHDAAKLIVDDGARAGHAITHSRCLPYTQAVGASSSSSGQA